MAITTLQTAGRSLYSVVLLRSFRTTSTYYQWCRHIAPLKIFFKSTGRIQQDHNNNTSYNIIPIGIQLQPNTFSPHIGPLLGPIWKSYYISDATTKGFHIFGCQSACKHNSQRFLGERAFTHAKTFEPFVPWGPISIVQINNYANDIDYVLVSAFSRCIGLWLNFELFALKSNKSIVCIIINIKIISMFDIWIPPQLNRNVSSQLVLICFKWTLAL